MHKTVKKTITVAIFMAFSSFSYAVNHSGVGTDNSVAVGNNSITTAQSGVATGDGAISTGENMTREQFATKYNEYQKSVADRSAKQNELTRLQNELATAQDAKSRLEQGLSDLIRQNAANQQIRDKRQQLQGQIDKLVADNQLSSSYKEFNNYYNLLSSLDWTQYGQANGIEKMRDQLRTATAKISPVIASSITNNDYDKYIHGYVNVETTLTNTLNKIKAQLSNQYTPYSYEISRSANGIKFNDTDLSDVIHGGQLDYNQKENVNKASEHVLSRNYLDRLNQIKQKENITTSDLTFLSSNYLLAHAKDDDFAKQLYGTTPFSGIASNYDIRTGGVIDGAIYSERHEEWISVLSSVHNNNLMSVSSARNGVIGSNDNYYKHVRFVLPVNYNGKTYFANPTFFINGMLATPHNPILSENTSAYSSFRQRVNDMIYMYEHIDTGFSKSMVDVADAKTKLRPFYENWKAAEHLLNLYDEINSTTDPQIKTAKQAEYLSKLNEYRSKENVDRLRELAIGENSAFNIDNPNHIKYTQAYQDFLRNGVADYAKMLADNEEGIIGYNREDQYIKQLEGVTNEIAKLEKQMPPEPPANPSITDAQQKVTEAENDVADKQQKVSDKQAEIAAINPSFPVSGINSIASGKNSFASGLNAIAIGANAESLGDNATVVGANSSSNGAQSVVLGANNTINSKNAKTVVVGSNNNITAANGNLVVVGSDTTTNYTQVGSDNIILGNKSGLVDDDFIKENDATYDPSGYMGDYPHDGIVSVGNSNLKRRIVNVAKGRLTSESTDAVNGSQLYDLQNRMRQLIQNETYQIEQRIPEPRTYRVFGTGLGVGEARVTNEYNETKFEVQTELRNRANRMKVDRETVTTDGYDFYTYNFEGADVKGDSNISASYDTATNTHNLALNKDLTARSLTIDNGAVLNSNGINANNKGISSLASGVDGTTYSEQGDNNAASVGDVKRLTQQNNIKVKAGANTTVSYDSTDNSYTVSSTGGTVGTPTEVKAGRNITVDKDAATGAYTVHAKDTDLRANGKYIDIRHDDVNGGYDISVNTTKVVGGRNVTVSHDETTNTYVVDANVNVAEKLIAGDNITIEDMPDNMVKISAKTNSVKAGDNVRVIHDKDNNSYTVSSASSAGKNGVEVTYDNAVNRYNIGLDASTLQKVQNGQSAYETVTNKGIAFKTDNGSTAASKLGDTLTVNGDGKNIVTRATSTGVTVELNRNVSGDSFTVNNGPKMSGKGIEMGGKGITGSASGIDGKLYATESDNNVANIGDVKRLYQNGNGIIAEQIEERVVNNFGQRLGGIESRIEDLDNKHGRAIAASNALSGLTQTIYPGRSMVTAGVGGYKNHQAVAVGFSRINDGGNIIIKVGAGANTKGKTELHYNASIGYMW